MLTPSLTQLYDGYKAMFFIREAEVQLQQLYLKNKLFSFVHFYHGQEAIAAGVCQALRPEDKALGNHRSHGHYLAKGGNFKKLACELLGKKNGASNGKGGSMHLIDKTANFIGTSPLLGSAVPIAAGVSFAQKFKNEEGITVVFYGDGASEEGVVYETYNLAALYKTPILFVLENNLHAVNSCLSERRAANYNLEAIAQGFGINNYSKVDGNSFIEVFNAATEAVKHIRDNSEPAIIECITYRHLAHSTPLMEEKFRLQDKIENRQASDPLNALKILIIEMGQDENSIQEFEQQTQVSIEDDILAALSSPEPDASELYTNVFN